MDIGKYKQALSHMLKDDPLKNITFNSEARLVDNDPIGYATGGKVGYADGTPFNYNALTNEQRVKAGKERVIKFVKDFKKENGRLPSQQEIRKQGKFDFATVKKAIESGSVKTLPLNQTKGEFTKVPVNNDLKILDQSKVIKDAFKSGELPSLKDIEKVLKITDPTKAANRITQLANVYTGVDEVEGIKPKFEKVSQQILDTNPYDYQIRDIYEKSISKSIGEKRTPGSIRTTIQRDIIPNVKGYSIDEPAGVTSSVRNKTTPYAVFSQIIDTDINKGDKYAFDSIKSKKEKVLQNAIASGDKKQIDKAVKDFNKIVSYYEDKINTDVKPGEKKVRLFKVSLDNPENTIKNFDNLPEQYQKAFKNNFAEKGYSYQVPKDIKTIYEIGEDLKNPKIAEDVAKRASKGQARIYSEFLPGTQVITTSVGNYLKDLAIDVKAGKIVSPFFKVLNPIGYGLGAYSVGETFKEGKPLPQVASSFFGLDPLIQSYREQSKLTPEAKNIQKRLYEEQVKTGESYVPGLDSTFFDDNMTASTTEKEKNKLQQEEKNIVEQLAKEEKLTSEERKPIVDYLKNRFSPFAKEEDSERQELAGGGEVGMGIELFKKLRLLGRSLAEIKNNLFHMSTAEKYEGKDKAINWATKNWIGLDKSPKDDVFTKIEETKKYLPKEYHSTLDDIKNSVESTNYTDAKNTIDAFIKTMHPDLKFENLPLSHFPMEDPLNDAFIILNPKDRTSYGRYRTSYKLDEDTGRGMRVTYDTWDPEKKEFLSPKEWKIQGAEDLEKGKEGLN